MRIWIQAEFGDDIHIFIHIMLFGIIIKTYKIPSDPQKVKKKKKKKRKAKFKGTEITQILWKSTKKRKIDYLEFKGDLGLADPALTAVTVGMLYSIVGSLIGFLSNIAFIKETKVQINPRYNNAIIKLYAECIFKLNIVNIIFAAIRLLKLYIKKKKG
ncbi:MAG: DUF2953 domain-containing protein [Clostridiaceae bacterium]|nr:DUF2953 domain-containing protein [Clostridiaceae bacterium]